MSRNRSIGDDTILTQGGRQRNDETDFAAVNPAVHRASTVLFDNMADFMHRQERAYDGYPYGTSGTPTARSLEKAIAALENGTRSIVTSSGMTAIGLCLLTFLKSGDHVLVPDCVYGTTRAFCDRLLKRLDISATFYDPTIGERVDDLIGPDTSMLLLEAPGSLTLEMQDIPAMVQVARQKNVLTVMDNTWASPLHFKPLDAGVDISMQAGTKYIGGHSDVLLGSLTVKDETLFRPLKDMVVLFGAYASPDDCYLTLRGLRTLGVRLHRHEASAMEIAEWLNGCAEVKNVLYPPLPSDPGHALWRRDFSGGSGLLGVVLKPCPDDALAAMIDGLELFGIGASWGGFESLVMPADPQRFRTATQWKESGRYLRLHVGLDDVRDLKADLSEGFSRLAAARRA